MAAQPASRYDGQTIEHYTIRWQEDLTSTQRAVIATEIERERFHPEYKWVKVDTLFVDESYQRPISEDRVWSIATNFTWRLYQALWVGQRHDKLYIVDGRHRYAAACILGKSLIPEVPVEIRRTQNVEEEARTFVELQEKRRSISSAQRFAAKLLYHDPMALDIQKIVTRHHFKIQDATTSFGTATFSKEQNVISAVGTLEAIYRAGGSSRLSAVLQVIRQAWDGVAPTTASWMLRAVNRLIEQTPNLNVERIARRLGEKDPWGLIERGQRFGHSNDIPASEAIADVLIKASE